MIAGDLFEEDYVSISDLKDLNHKFSTLGKTSVIIGAGNHDPIVDSNAKYKLIQWAQNVTIMDVSMETVTLSDCKVKIHGFSWDKLYLPAFSGASLETNSTDFDMADDDYAHILMLHGDVYNKSEYLYIDPSILEGKGFDYVALGHIHKHDFVRPWMAYPGSLEPMDFSETGKHGFIEGHIQMTQDKAKVTEATFKPFAKRSFHIVEVMIQGDMAQERIIDEITKTIKATQDGGDMTKDMYRIVLEGYVGTDVELDMTYIESTLQDVVYYLEIRDKTQIDLDLDQLRSDYEGTLIGAYIEHIEKMAIDSDLKEEALYEGLRILLREQVMS